MDTKKRNTIFCIVAVMLSVFWFQNAFGYQINLNKGLNLISLPQQPANTAIDQVTSSIKGKFNSIWAYVGGSWKLYNPGDPNFSDLLTMEAGQGYWIDMKENGALSGSGTAAPSSIPLSTGWNLVGYNCKSLEISNALASIQGKYDSVWAFKAGVWKLYDPGNPNFSDLTTMDPGFGYWINAKQSTTWTCSTADDGTFEVIVTPSASPQTVTFGDLSVTIPGGLLSTSQTLKLTKVTNAPPPNFKGLDIGGAYDIQLGDLHNFEGEITIRMKYDPAAIRNDMALERALSAAYWDTQQNAWITLPIEVDNTTNEIIVKTRHLSLFSWTMVKLGWQVHFKNHFYIVYDKAEVTDPNFLRWYTNPDHSNYVDINVPNYIEDVMAFLIEAYKEYVDGYKFKSPPTPIDVYVGTDLHSFSEKITGIILISLLPQWPEPLKMTTAHELFHRVQNAYYYDIGGMLWLKWWLESTADYAGEHVVWKGKINQMGNKLTRNYLESPLTDAGEAHDNGYSTSHFIKFLVDNGADFKKMWEFTAAYDYSLFLLGLNSYLEGVHGADGGLGAQYRKFARYFVFDSNSPMPAITDSLHSEVAAYRSTMSSGNPQESAVFGLKGGYTAKLWGIWFSASLFDQNTTKLKYKVSLDGTLPSGVEADVYVLKGDKRVAGGGTPAGTLSQTQKFVDVEIEKGDAVYVLAVNGDKDDFHQIKVNIGEPLGALTFKFAASLRATEGDEACMKTPLKVNETVTFNELMKWTGTSFTAEITGNFDATTWTISCSGTLSADMKTLTSFTLDARATSSTSADTSHFELRNMPGESENTDPPSIVFKASGSEVASYVSGVSYSTTIGGIQPFSCTWTVIDYNASTIPMVELSFAFKQ